jgi:hypothetical protein
VRPSQEGNYYADVFKSKHSFSDGHWLDHFLGFKHSWVVIEKSVHPLGVVAGQTENFRESINL